MRATYDPEANALYVYLQSAPVARTECDETWDRAIDFDAEGDVVGYEFLLGRPLEILTDENTASSGHILTAGADRP